MTDAFEEPSTARVGRGKGTRAVLPAGWGLEAGPAGWAEGLAFILSMRDHEQDVSRECPVPLGSLTLLGGNGVRGEDGTGRKV